MKLEELSDEHLEQLRQNKVFEMQNLDKDFIASRAAGDDQIEREWRSEAVKYKRDLCESLRLVNVEIKKRKSRNRVDYGVVLTDISSKLDNIIKILGNF